MQIDVFGLLPLPRFMTTFAPNIDKGHSDLRQWLLGVSLVHFSSGQLYSLYFFLQSNFGQDVYAFLSGQDVALQLHIADCNVPTRRT